MTLTAINRADKAYYTHDSCARSGWTPGNSRIFLLINRLQERMVYLQAIYFLNYFYRFTAACNKKVKCMVFCVHWKGIGLMAYEIFEKKRTRLGTPVMSFSKIGGIAFNQTAARILREAGIKNVLLLWDRDSRSLALKVIKDEKDVRSYVIRYNAKASGAGFSAKTFLDHAGIDYSQRKPINVEITPDKELLLEVNIPDFYFSIPKLLGV